MADLAESVISTHLSLSGLTMPLTIRLAEPISDDDLITFSDRNRSYQIERNKKGELEIMSPLGFEGGVREAYVMRVLGNWAELHGGVCASSDTGFRLGDSAVRSPDASWISDDRVSQLTAEERRRFAPFCPEFLIEILSELDRRSTLEAKMWIEHGARLAWMIDPFAATVTIYEPGAAASVLSRPEAVAAETVVRGFRLEMAKLWAK